MTDVWDLVWVAGPDAGGTALLGDGDHVVGRAPGVAARCDDPALEPHHLLIQVSEGGALLRQLTGQVPVRIDGEVLTNPTVVVAAARLEIGHSILSLRRRDLTAPGHNPDPANLTATPGGTFLVRHPRAATTLSPDLLKQQAPHQTSTEVSGGILPAVLALGGSGLIAVLLHQPMFLLFGALGAIVAFGTWGGQRISFSRRRRRDVRLERDAIAEFERAVELQRSAFVAHHIAYDSTPVTARRAIEGLTVELWARRVSHLDGFAVSVGLGSVPWSPRLDESSGTGQTTGCLGNMCMLADVALTTEIGGTCRLAVRGDPDRSRSTVRSIVMQLAANCGPADLRLVVVSREPARWRWLEGLPHTTTAAGLVAVVDESDLLETVAEYDVAPHPHLVVITDAPELLAARTSPLRRAVVGDRSTALIVLVGPDGGIPHVCSSLLDLYGPTHGRWHADVALASLPVQARCFGISERSATRLVNCLSGLVDPEDPLGEASGIPREVTLLSLLPSLEPAAIAAAWVAAGVDPVPRTVIGVAGDGVVDIDLDRDGPHALMAGTTGAGKSELLRTLVVGLSSASSPDHITFVLIDYKGGSTFDACGRLPHVVGVVTDLDDHLANRALRSFHAELRRREQLLRSVGAADLAAFRRMAPTEVLPRLVVVIDEFAALVSEQPEFLHALVGIAQRGRSLGVHLILATQRPSGVISDDIRANTNLRLALRLHDSADALDVIGDRSPSAIPRGLAGRAVMRLGPDEMLTFQTARCTTPLADGGTELDVLVDVVRDAAELVGARSPRSPMLPPLVSTLPIDEAAVAQGIVGTVDDPDGQRMVPLRWTRADGHLLLVGASGGGVTSTLTLLGTVAATDRSGSHIYVIDGRGGPALAALTHSPWCAAVVLLHERERLLRVVTRVADELGRRIAAPTAPRYPILVLVDGLDAVRQSLDDIATAVELEMLDSVIALGSAHDVVIVGAVDRVAALPSSVLARFAQRWLFHLTDPLDATGLGMVAADVPGPVPGRLFVTSMGLEAQLMVGSVPLPSCADGEVPSPVECLPAVVDAADLCSGQQREGDVILPIGLRFDNGEACNVDVPDGEHLLIIGPARSGRSTALRRVVRAWLDASPDGWWRVVAPRRATGYSQNRCRSLDEVLDHVPPTGRVLIAVDDAELVDDVGGALASLAASRRAGLMIVATGKPDSLRQSYGHWTGVVRRSRLGVVSTACNELDGDLLGAFLPRRIPVAARPGLAWLVSDGTAVLAQIAMDAASEVEYGNAPKQRACTR
ncbi:MAG: FtsK/SpoIIIE domain-containing protein [Ilumatobacteraceae bacterium]